MNLYNDKTAQEVTNNSLVLIELEKELNKVIVDELENGNINTVNNKVDNIINNYNQEFTAGVGELKDYDTAFEEFTSKNKVPIIGVIEQDFDNYINTINASMTLAIKDMKQSVLLSYRTIKASYNQELINNRSKLFLADFTDLKALEDFNKNLTFKKIKGDFVAKGNDIYVIRNNRKYQIERVHENIVRDSITIEADERLNNNLASYGLNLVRISYHADCSPLCLQYQGKIYDKSGTSKKYPPYEAILWSNGGGFRHPNCRHFVSPYFPNASSSFEELYVKKLSNKKILQGYDKRKQGMTARNNYFIYQKKLDKALLVNDEALIRKYSDITKKYKNIAIKNGIFLR